MAEKRLHYYDQQFLQEPDFTQEQHYHMGMRRRHNEKLHGQGVVEGLAVSKKDNRNVTIGAGMALDSAGKEMVIDTSEDVAIPATPKTTFIVTITYSEELTDPPPPEFQISPTDRTRVTEKPQFPVFKLGDTIPTLNIPLAEVKTNNSGNITTVDNAIKSGRLVPTGEEIREARGSRSTLGERLEATFDIETDYPFKNIVWIDSFIGRQSTNSSKFLTLINQNMMSKHIRIRGYVEGSTIGGLGAVLLPRNGFGTTRLSYRSGSGDQVWIFYTPKFGQNTTNLLFTPNFRCTRVVFGQSRTYQIQLDFRNNRLTCRVLGFMPASTGTPPFALTGGARIFFEIAWR